MPEPMTDERLADLRFRCHKDNADFYRYTWSFRVAREFIAEIDRLRVELAAERERMAKIHRRLIVAVENQGSTLHDVGAWQTFALNLAAEIAATDAALHAADGGKKNT
ncbi:MAG: hypothetical protein V1784_09695 [bacterium]